MLDWATLKEEAKAGVKMETIQWDGKIVGFRFISDIAETIRWRKLYSKPCLICAICKCEITEGSVWLVISNQANIPNRYCHSKCVQGKTFNETMKLIADDYEMAKFHIEWLKNSGWWREEEW
jgi:hypothetical protein